MPLQVGINEVAKVDSKEFEFKVGNQRHVFAAKDSTQRDAWHAAIQDAMLHAKTLSEELSTGVSKAVVGMN